MHFELSLVGGRQYFGFKPYNKRASRVGGFGADGVAGQVKRDAVVWRAVRNHTKPFGVCAVLEGDA